MAVSEQRWRTIRCSAGLITSRPIQWASQLGSGTSCAPAIAEDRTEARHVMLGNGRSHIPCLSTLMRRGFRPFRPIRM
jgi:hypothetical protein